MRVRVGRGDARREAGEGSSSGLIAFSNGRDQGRYLFAQVTMQASKCDDVKIHKLSAALRFTCLHLSSLLDFAASIPMSPLLVFHEEGFELCIPDIKCPRNPWFACLSGAARVLPTPCYNNPFSFWRQQTVPCVLPRCCHHVIRCPVKTIVSALTTAAAAHWPPLALALCQHSWTQNPAPPLPGLAPCTAVSP